MTEPWNNWKDETREYVLWMIEGEIRNLELRAKTLSWAAFPVTRGQHEDGLRALRELRAMIIKRDEFIDPIVGMGEEPAP